jgi:precorrin-2 dehydrogenase/sirohydrochlorin ferrochelatase
MKSYPITLIGLEHKRCVVVGGGSVAVRKITGLIAAGARPVVISSTIKPALNSMLKAGLIEYIPRKFHPSDLEDAFLVIAATRDPELNQQVWEAARRAGALVNVVDTPQMCDFFNPAVVRRGDFLVSISTGGNAPMLASHVRQELEARFGHEYEVLTAWCAAIRPILLEIFPDPKERKFHWRTLLGSPVLSLLSTGREDEARAWIEEKLGTRVADSLPPKP